MHRDLLRSTVEVAHKGASPRSVCEAKLKLRAGGRLKLHTLWPPLNDSPLI